MSAASVVASMTRTSRPRTDRDPALSIAVTSFSASPALLRIPGGRRVAALHALVPRHRLAECFALDLVAAEDAQEIPLLHRFDAFGDDRELERVRERNDGGDDRAALPLFHHGHDESAV